MKTIEEKNRMRVVQINTTAFEEEDFLLMTTLTDDQIEKVIMPVINKEREGLGEYDNESLVELLKEQFPLEFIEEIRMDYFSL